MSWIEDEARRIQARDAQKADQRTLQLHKADVLRNRADVLYSELVNELRRNVEHFNQLFPNEPRRRIVMTMTTDGSHSLKGGPREVVLYLDDDCQTIRYEVSGVGVASPPSALELSVDSEDRVSIKDVTLQMAAQVLLKPITSGMMDD